MMCLVVVSMVQMSKWAIEHHEMKKQERGWWVRIWWWWFVVRVGRAQIASSPALCEAKCDRRVTKTPRPGFMLVRSWLRMESFFSNSKLSKLFRKGNTRRWTRMDHWWYQILCRAYKQWGPQFFLSSIYSRDVQNWIHPFQDFSRFFVMFLMFP